MMSSKCDSKKSRKFLRAFAEYVKHGSTDFHQTYAILAVIYSRLFIVAMVTNSGGSAGHEEVW